MKNITNFLLFSLLAVLLSGGCAHYSSDLGAFTGSGIKDLEKAAVGDKGIRNEKILPLPYDRAFDRITETLKGNRLTVFQSDRKKRYITVMGFQKQIDTTRVGIFFEPLEDEKTKVTLSSLSSTALSKAETIIFGGVK
ncbi:MAG: hypothetical protein DRP85_05105 [Candidatus Makaraimicrobium thalassicum]|nr:MAG: hypothetical protein DRP85_05105 [Candidatus Omnitrophota bacterium]